MKNVIIRTIFVALLGILAMGATAQTACDRLYASGVKQQQTMTVAAQNKAIEYFEKAKACYDAKKNKDLCDNQISVCRSVIRQLKTGRPSSVAGKKDSVAVAESSARTKQEAVVEEVKDPEAEISLEKVYLKFKGKGGEFQKVKVICNYDDWKVASSPEWAHFSVSSNKEVVVEVDRNPSKKEERSGTITVECRGKTAILTIIQEKFKKFGVI